MSTRGLALFVLTLVPAGAGAQESSASVHAPLVVADHQTRFQKLVDIDGDGFLDAFSGWWINDQYDQIWLQAFLNDGTGNLLPSWRRAPSANGGFWAFAAGDVNGDGFGDVVFGCGHEVSLYITGPGGSVSTQGAIWNAGEPNVRGLALLDVDHDGVQEIAVLASTLSILRYDTPSSFTPVASLSLGAVNGELQTADVNGDGETDLLAWDATRVMLIPVIGGQPQAPATFVHGFGDPKAQAGDLDGDGDEDVVVFDMGQYSLLRRTGPATFVPEGPFVGGPARFLFDVDGDGDLDGACCGGGGPLDVFNANPSIFRIALNDGTGVFAPAIEFPGLGSERLAGAGDLDHDGDLDLVAGRCVLYGTSRWVEDLPRAFSSTARPENFADLDADHDPDAEPGAVPLRNAGDGGFEPFACLLPPPSGAQTWLGPGYPGDFDGDGDLDLLVGVRNSAQPFLHMELLKNCGGGSFVDGGQAGPDGMDMRYTGQLLTRARDVLARDADGDGDVDLVVRNYPFASSKVYWNDGSGSFSAGPSWTNQVLVRDVRDMNGDGLPDLLGYYRYTSDWEVMILPGAGGGAFGPIYHVFWTSTHTAPYDAFDIGDADGDGDLDLVSGDQSGLYLFQNSGQAAITYGFLVRVVLDPRLLDESSATSRGALFSDVDLDGKLDVVAWPVSYYSYDAPNGSAILRRRADNSGYEAPTYHVFQPLTKLDVDGDGDEDFVGSFVHRGRRFEGRADGIRRQSGPGVAGAGGVTPTLGADGPFRVGESAELCVTGAAGGTPLWLHQRYVSDPPVVFTGGRARAQQQVYIPPMGFSTSGTFGDAGVGRWTLPFTVPAYVGGRTKHYWVTLDDPLAAGGEARTNDLFLTYGP